MTEPRLDTAHESWDRGWGQAETRARWAQAEPAVTELIRALRDRGAQRVADVGTGIGRHALAFARAGFEVIAVDASANGLAEMRRAAFAECRRVLHAGGTLQLTMLSKRNRAFGVGREIRPDTFVDDASTGDKDHPHFYVDATTLTAMLSAANLQARSVVDVDQSPPGAFHWTVLAEAVPDADGD